MDQAKVIAGDHLQASDENKVVNSLGLALCKFFLFSRVKDSIRESVSGQ